jgi:hypothetical protein
MDAIIEQLRAVANRLERLESQVEKLGLQSVAKEFYTTEEVACLLNKASFTVREWCRHGRINAIKRNSGRGAGGEWGISHEELTRIRNHGLLPVRRSWARS